MKRTVSILAEEILKFENPDIFLGAGSLANSLFFYKYSKYTNEDFYLKLALAEFEKVYDRLEDADIESNMNLVSGYAGVAWLFQYYVNQNILEYDSDFFIFFDEAIINQCKKDEVLGRYDLFYGIIGYASYFLQRSKYDRESANKYLNEIVLILKNLSIEDESGIYWFSDIFSEQKNKINIGMAHGIPSIVSFLIKVYNLNQNDLAKKMAIQATNWILKFKSQEDIAYSLFPYLVEPTIKEEQEPKTTRLAWCYGDLSIGYVIYALGNSINDDYYINEGLYILNKCSNRKIDSPYTEVHDRAFCHGSTGIYYIYNKLFKKHELDSFKDAKNYWFEKTILNKDENINSLKSYGMVDGKVHYAHDYGLINGYPGIGVALISDFQEDSNEWDEIFML